MSTDNKYEWFAIRTISGQEKKVKQAIETEVRRQNLESFINQILLPIEKVFEIKQGKKRSRERLLYPGYMFLNLYVITKDNQTTPQPEIMQLIKDTPGVVSFVGSERGKHPIPLRESEIQSILQKIEEAKESGEMIETPFTRGETIKIMDGHFSGFSGVIEEVMEDKKKLKVLVKIFGRNTPVELNYLQVERLT
ncbi:MAG: transcription termination/antitermination protein NusG [Bacteroidia bacterium]|nr:transcription termination/antitermination protein NusG [Bacteroidia bacterium]MDW8158655.1 transcription termination/antitermination protein NusG [Bacteroidia bacterium]